MLLSTVRNRKLQRLVVSYDIACRYSKKFRERVSSYCNELQIDFNKVKVEFVIPQFHIIGHVEACWPQYLLRFREHMARTDGENIERGWAAFNLLSMSTREMGAGTREDVLNHQFQDWNFQRILLFGEMLSYMVPRCFPLIH